jgi:D-glycero-alpha-D-manno-heptose 1-phosphate guanylyltransferase
MQALILAGGLGTRLREIAKNIPKVMVNIKGKPFLKYLILQLKNYNLNDIILCTGYLKEKIKNYFGNGNHLEVSIIYSDETEPLGTGGAIKFAKDLILEDNFLVMNGDSFFDIDLRKLINYHYEREALTTMALVEVKDTKRFGIVKIGNNGEIESFFEKRKKQGLNLINGGIYLLNRKIFDYIPKSKEVSLEEEIFPKLIGKGFYGVSFDNYFIDIGVPEDYRKLQENPNYLFKLLSHKRRK